MNDSSSSSSLMHSPAHSSSEEFADVSMEIEFLNESLQIIGETPVKTQKLSQKRYPQQKYERITGKLNLATIFAIFEPY